VQHDRRGRRRLVARAYPGTAGRDFSSASGAAKFSASADPSWRFAEIAGGDSFRRRMHGCMSRARGTRPRPGHSTVRITWRNLVFSDDDFIRQYFQVNAGKYCNNHCHRGTFND
jgi:hypothetical protein